MKIDHDALLFATRLVEEMGESAIRISLVRLVELTAANNLRAAAFWRDVMRASESLLTDRSPHPGAPAHNVAHGTAADHAVTHTLRDNHGQAKGPAVSRRAFACLRPLTGTGSYDRVT